MESITGDSPLIVVLGPTASGKTALGLDIATRFNGEVIAADSRTIYKGMDIATAKPTYEERLRTKHHLLDVVWPDQPFNAADFQRLASAAIEDIAGRGKLPLLVGGSGLYIDAVVYGYGFRPAPDPDLRSELNNLSVRELQERLRERSIQLPPNESNPRHLIRTLETGGLASTHRILRPGTLVLGLDRDRDALEKAISKRVDMMIEQGLIEEIARLSSSYGWELPAMQIPAYKAFRGYFEGRISLDDAKRLFIQFDLQYSKRQKTWFRRSNDIIWISETTGIVDLITTFLNK